MLPVHSSSLSLLVVARHKVHNDEAQANLETEHGLRFQVLRVCISWGILHYVQKLHEDILDKGIITDVALIMQYLGEEVVVGCAIHKNIGQVKTFNDTMKGYDARYAEEM